MQSIRRLSHHYQSVKSTIYLVLRLSGQRGMKRILLRTGFSLLPIIITLISLLPAHAQTAYAPGGLFVHPTAFTPRAHQYSMYSAAFTQDEEEGNNDSYYPITFTYTPTDRLQVSALAIYHQGKDHPSHTHLGGFLKYQLVQDTPSHPAFALAGAYIHNDHLESSVAGVFSHAFVSRKRLLTTLHLGAKWGRTSEKEGGVDDIGGFIGAQVPLSRAWDIVGETSTRLKFDRSSASSIGFMYHTRGGTGISLGLVNGGRSSRMKLFFGVGLPLGN
jgi:hypothetical protein